MSVSDKTRGAILWKSTEVLGQRLVWFVIGMILARLVSPADFGLIAVIMMLNMLAISFVDSGFSAALIQKQDTTYTDECSVFWFNLLAGSLIALSLVIAAPGIAAFFDQPVLKPLTWLMAANLCVQSWSGVQFALLSKAMNFKVQMQAGLTSTLIAGIIAIAMAWNDWGVWALATQIVAATIIRTLLLWILHHWRPSRVFSLQRLRNMFEFGSYIFFGRLLNVVGSQFHIALIGRYYSTTDLGFYNRASSTGDLLQSVMSNIYASVAFPLFSTYADDQKRLRESMRKSLVAMMAINLPAMAGLMVTADVLIPTLFGEQWSPSVPYMRVLCLAGILHVLQVANLEVLKAQGFSKLFFRLGVINRTLMIITVLATAQISILAIAWGMVAVSTISYFINAHYSAKLLDFGALHQLREVAPYILLTVLMTIAVMAIGTLIKGIPTGWQALIQVLTGGTLYFAAVIGLKMEAANHARELLRLQ